MYLAYYGFAEKPFQLKPDPNFFFPSRGHKRAAAYLEYGLSQEDGFIIITGDVGAGKTTLMRYLFQKLRQERVAAAQLVSTRLDPDDALRMVAAAFGLSYEGLSKAALLLELEQFMRKCERESTRVLLVVDEAQNLLPQTLEELRMLSNFQSDNRPLLQTFLLGQPEFRRTLLGSQMQQLRQRVIATYHLGPLDQAETRAYIEHRLQKAGWNGSPVLQDEIFEVIHNFSAGIPRKINLFCDRLLIMGCLEELQTLGKAEANEVMLDIQKEFDLAVSPE
ncbi:XrtA/PEP-CTERM system-associated ATPase [Nitrosomonas sp. H1_AOB3]|uniref:XrtA/PEP-CTERM system-associated ATPase n=1 Tax=Nitrosomonas sp. H1_AOB3 TaxID=2741553 RepID=UPI00193610FD|nr:XrtA/PEP-CTERM system-associated ATPase [Nitrosomonas sp. H1_AOB3]QOJ08251.1 MAG: AAA family ATPase [Nitrosomonas sp. H1_AOB3]